MSIFAFVLLILMTRVSHRLSTKLTGDITWIKMLTWPPSTPGTTLERFDQYLSAEMAHSSDRAKLLVLWSEEWTGDMSGPEK
jgi:hypothetical protein